MKYYNGHRSWNAWNVSLWINNDENLYQLATRIAHEYRQRCNSTPVAAHFAARAFLKQGPEKTPDGARYNQLCVRLVMEDILSEA